MPPPPPIKPSRRAFALPYQFRAAPSALFLAFLLSRSPLDNAKMTSTRDAHTIEARKARYSRELAAYTLRQWDLVRQSAESDGDDRDKSASPSGSHSGRSRSLPRDNNKPSRASQGETCRRSFRER